MASYSHVVEQELRSFNTVEVKQILRMQNSLADTLARLTNSEKIEELENIPIRTISNVVINQPEHVITTTDLYSSWIDEIVYFLKDGRVLPDTVEARKLRTRTARGLPPPSELIQKGLPQSSVYGPSQNRKLT
ncbi:Uncharacterized protein Adt_26939 [Abeliophyllum distichum]|uniref:Uncharacterized protein n=1 Tax=Abeliophyllum distichum TaxID=126358 RepID=A0ABD1RSZ7_9LAMI